MRINFLYLFLILVMISCKDDKKEVLLADREAPLGWIYLKMYDNKSFEFISQGMLRDKEVYQGNYELKSDTLYFTYQDSIPKVGSKAIIDGDFVNYLNESYPERVQIKLNHLSNKK